MLKRNCGFNHEMFIVTRNVFLFRVNRDVSEDIVKDDMNGKDLKYVSIKTMSNAEAVFKSF